MRVFWAIIGVLVLVTGGLFVVSGEPGDGGGDDGSVAARDPGGGRGGDGPVDPGEAETAGEDEPAEAQGVVVSTADPVVREAESVEAGLAEGGIEIAGAAGGEGASPGPAASPVEVVDAERGEADARDGEQVVLDAIAAQTADGTGKRERGEGVESDWLVSEAEHGAPEAETDAPVGAVADKGTDASEDAGVAAVADGVSAPSDEVADAGDDDGDANPAPAAAPVEPLGGSGGPIGGVAEVVKKEAASAPAGPGGTVERREDGSLLVNGSIVVKGAGTEASPYEVPWDLFVSASRSYAPEKGKEQLPAWAMELDGKWVRVRGYLLLPVMATDTKELLVMLNQWDGCCIGVPPSPYDAAEVRLTRSVDQSVGGAGFVNYGTIKGRLDVDPYIVGGWLLGLYVIEGAEVETGSGTKGT